jgi:hypothetical protein
MSIKINANHPWVKGILNCSNKVPGPLKRGDNHKMQEFGEVIEKFSPREPLSQNSSDFHERFLTNINSTNYRPRGSGGATRGETIFACVYYIGKNLLK